MNAPIKYESIRCPNCKKHQTAAISLKADKYSQRLKNCKSCNYRITGTEWLTVNDL